MADEKSTEAEPASEDVAAKEAQFASYEWADDDGWCVIEQRLEYPAHITDARKEEFLLKRKRKYYKQKVDPDYKIPPKPQRAAPKASTSAGASTSHSTSSTGGSAAGGSSSAGTSSSGASSHRYTPPTQSSSRAGSALSGLLNYYYVASQWATFVLSILSVVNPYSFWRALYVAIAMHLVALFQNNGRPKLSQEYANRVMQDDNMMCAGYALVFVFARQPSLLFLSPIILRSLVMGSYMLHNLLHNKAPALHGMVSPLLSRVLARQQWFFQTVPLLEAWVGIYLVVAIIWMPGSVLLSLFYWQIMHVRYMASQATRSAFYQVNMKLEGIFGRVPIVLTYYRKLTGLLYGMVDPVKLRERANAPRPSCTVM